MSLKPEQIDELLNGMLDGVLTDDEQRLFDAACEKDPSLQARLDELAAFRRSLLRGRSVGRLGPDFAKQVLMKARERADLMDDPPEWIKPNASPGRRAGRASSESRRERSNVSGSVGKHAIRPLLSAPTSPNEGETASDAFARRAWRVWVPSLLAVTAASLALLVISSFWPPSNPRDIAENNSIEAEKSIAERGDKGLGFPNLPSNSSEISEDPSNIESRPNQDHSKIAGLDPKMDPKDGVASTVVNPNVDPAIESSIGSIASDAPKSDRVPMNPDKDSSVAATSSTVAPNIGVSSDIAMTPGDQLIENMMKDLEKKGLSGDLFFTTIADVSASTESLESKLVQDLLDKYEIVYSKDDDLVLDNDQLNVMVSTNLVKPAIGRETKIDASGEVSVYFLRAPGLIIDSFLTEITGSVEEFPSYRMDLSFDPSVLGLVNQLGGVLDRSDAPLARRLAYQAEGVPKPASGFVGVDRGQGIPSDARLKYAAEAAKNRTDPKASMSVKRGAPSYLLLIVRPAKDL
jgi:hypothetical protein